MGGVGFMGWEAAVVLAVVLVVAFPLAIGICALLGWTLMTFDQLMTRCPNCTTRNMSAKNGIRETYPTGRGSGRFYLCHACGQRSFWDNDSRAWLDASVLEFK